MLCRIMQNVTLCFDDSHPGYALPLFNLTSNKVCSSYLTNTCAAFLLEKVALVPENHS